MDTLRNNRPATSLAGFTPRCLDCSYELTGLPDGRCPECGRTFSHTDLIVAEQQRREFRSPGHAALYIALALAATPCFWANAGPASLVPLALMWALTIAWVVQHRPQLVGRGAVGSLWIILPLARTSLGFVDTPAAVPVAALCLLAIGFVVRYSYQHHPVGTVCALGLSAGVPLFAVGLIVTLEGLRGMRAGFYWSDWNYPPGSWAKSFGDRRAPHVMLYNHMLIFGLVALALSVPPLLAAMLALFGRWPRRGEIAG